MAGLEISGLPVVAAVSEHGDRDMERRRRARKHPAAADEVAEGVQDLDAGEENHTVDDTA